MHLNQSGISSLGTPGRTPVFFFCKAPWGARLWPHHPCCSLPESAVSVVFLLPKRNLKAHSVILVTWVVTKHLGVSWYLEFLISCIGVLVTWATLLGLLSLCYYCSLYNDTVVMTSRPEVVRHGLFGKNLPSSSFCYLS